MTTFIESPRFPEEVSAWALGGPEYNTLIVQSNSGVEKRNVVWSYPLGMWNLSAGMRTLANAQNSIAFHRLMFGRAYGFRFKDPFDNAVSFTQGVVGAAGIGDGTPTYQLYKNYTLVSQTVNRKIFKPVNDATLSIERNGVAITVGPALNASVDYTTGVATFAYDHTSNVSSIVVGTTTDVTLGAALTGIGPGDLLYLDGFAGADAALLNAKAHTVITLVGSNYTVGTNTAGKTITLGTAAGFAYPQPRDTLTWSGNFDTPVRFDNDWLQLQMDPGGLLQVNNAIVRELRL